MKIREFIISLPVLLIVCCNPNIKQVTDTHEGEETKNWLTSYSSDFELFAEADPFVVGKSSNVLTHLTRLSDFKPLDSAIVIINLVIDQKVVTQKLEKPIRGGIYSFDIIPSDQGTGKLVFEIFTSEGEFKVEVPSVEVFSEETDAAEAAENAEISEINAIVFTKEQSWKTEFSTDPVSAEPFGQVIKTVAQIESAIDDEIIVNAKTNVAVLFSGLNVLDGQNISQGQPLFTISGEGLAENNSSLRYSEAQNNWLKAKADFERQKELVKDQIVSEKEFIITKTEFENTSAIYEMLSKNFSPSGQTVTSPSSGFIKSLYVKNGQYVEAGEPVMSVLKNKTLLLRAGVRQKYAHVLGSLSSAVIRIPEGDQTYTLEELNGKVLSYGRNADKDNYLVPVILQVDNNGSLIPGGFAELYLKTRAEQNRLTVPNSSLLEEQGNYFVMVQLTPELFEKRVVKVGSSDGLRSEIIEGLNRNERIVTKGAIMVKLAQSSGTLDPHAGHVH